MLTRSRGAVAIAVVAVGIGVWLAWPSPAPPEQGTAGVLRRSPEAPEALVLPTPRPEPAALTHGAPPTAAPATPAARAPSGPGDAALGTVGGVIFDYSGVPLGKAKLQLLYRQEFVGALGSEAVSDEQGWFQFESVPPGPWELFAAVECPGVSSKGRHWAGAVVVPAGQFVRVDVRLPGTAELSGQYTVYEEGMDGIVLELELRPRWEPARLVACVTLTSFRAAQAPPEPQRAADGAPPGPRDAEDAEEPDAAGEQARREPPVGSFRLTGLAADEYRLRIWLDRKHDHYLDRFVDLTDGSVVLAPEQFSLDDFGRATLARQGVEVTEPMVTVPDH